MYYSNLDKENIKNNKRFWKTVKRLLSDKPTHKEKINLSEKREILKTDMESAKVLNNFFSNVAQNYNISRFLDSDR